VMAITEWSISAKVVKYVSCASCRALSRWHSGQKIIPGRRWRSCCGLLLAGKLSARTT